MSMYSYTKQIPVYSLDHFRTKSQPDTIYQVEVFDANRHFEVSYPHRHDFYEILYLNNGSGFHIIDNNRYPISPPCVFFMSPGQTHKLELSQDISGYIFLFTSEFYLINQDRKSRLLEFPFFFPVDRRNPPLELKNEKDDLFLRGLFIRGCEEIDRKDDHSDSLVRSLLDLILVSCEKLYPGELHAIKTGRGHFLVKQFLLLIEENYQKNLRVSNYADMLAVTPNHLTQMVREVTGKTSVALLREKYILEIKRLLLHSNLTVSEIAGLMNFEDQSYLTKYFKKCTGNTPRQFKRESMKNT
jgi:AraC family transcriptional activator of pobA